MTYDSLCPHEAHNSFHQRLLLISSGGAAIDFRPAVRIAYFMSKTLPRVHTAKLTVVPKLTIVPNWELQPKIHWLRKHIVGGFVSNCALQGPMAETC